MKDLNWELKQLGLRHRDGSFATQHDRERVLTLVADQLIESGFETLMLAGMKPLHIEELVKRWQGEALATGTLKNRMTHLRWMAQKIGKQNIVARDNDFYGIADRVYVTNDSKARELTAEQLGKVTDPYCAMSLQLQAAFGLRREESLKLQPNYADRDDLAEYVRSHYAYKRQALQVTPTKEQQSCHSTNAVVRGGSISPRHRESALDALLKQKARPKPRSCRTG